jgi:hypothetical protein
VQGMEAGGGSDGSTQEAGALGRCIRRRRGDQQVRLVAAQEWPEAAAQGMEVSSAGRNRRWSEQWWRQREG